MGKIDDRLAELGYVLPAATEPKGTYVNTVRSGGLIFTAGHISQAASGELILGKVGKDLTPEEGYAAAHRVVLSLLATLKKELGDLDHIKRFVKLTGFVNCVDGFTQQPAVINGASDAVSQIFGAKGRHARSAVGTNALPLNVAVEIEAIVEVEPSAPSLSSLAVLPDSCLMYVAVHRGILLEDDVIDEKVAVVVKDSDQQRHETQQNHLHHRCGVPLLVPKSSLHNWYESIPTEHPLKPEAPRKNSARAVQVPPEHAGETEREQIHLDREEHEVKVEDHRVHDFVLQHRSECDHEDEGTDYAGD